MGEPHTYHIDIEREEDGDELFVFTIKTEGLELLFTQDDLDVQHLLFRLNELTTQEDSKDE